MFDPIDLTQFSHAVGCELAYVFAISQTMVYSYSKVLYKSGGYNCLFKNFKDIFSGIVFSNCRDSTNINLVFTGLINYSEFLQHHSATKRRSVSSLYLASDISSTGNDKDILESSTNEVKSHGCKKVVVTR